MFHFTGQSKPTGNAQRFATMGEASKSAIARFNRWTMPSDWSVERSTDPVNYIWDDELGDVSIEDYLSGHLL